MCIWRDPNDPDNPRGVCLGIIIAAVNNRYYCLKCGHDYGLVPLPILEIFTDSVTGRKIPGRMDSDFEEID